MTLSELLNDLTARFLEVEKNHYAQIANLKAQMNAVNSNYEIMKKKHSVIIQNIILVLAPIAFMYIFPYIAAKNQAFFQELFSKHLAMRFAVIATCVSPIAAPILNYIRSKIKHKKQIRKAEKWWEQTGKNKIVELNNTINSIKEQAYNLLNANPLYECLKNTDFCNSSDCYEMYLIAKSYQYNSIEEVLSFFYKEKINEFEREETERRHQEILDALNEANEESVRLREELAAQGRRADFDRTILEMQLSEIRHRR